MDDSYWKGRKWHSLVLAAVLAVPIACGLWITYNIIHQAGQVLYELILVIIGNGSSTTVITASVVTQSAVPFSLQTALFAILVFSLAAWLLEWRTRNKIFWWYPAFVALFELSRELELVGFEAIFIMALACLTFFVIFGLGRKSIKKSS